MATLVQLMAVLEGALEPHRFKDYGPNGLQVEGRAEVRRLVSGVTASRALIDAAIEANADALLVHHGLFWRGHDGRLVGWLAERVKRLMRHDISLIAYHLPLDAHPQWGNNAQLGRVLDLTGSSAFGEQGLGWLGQPTQSLSGPASGATDASLRTLEQWVAHVESCLGRAVVAVPGDGRPVRTVAWCTGGAQGYFEAAIAAGADLYLTGEISEPQAHLARETGVAYLACGHHATERYGAPALGAAVAGELGLDHQFIDIENPA